MNIRFRPSLQLLAKVRIALKLLLRLDFRIVLADLLREHGGMESFYKECIHQNGPGLSLEFTVERNIVSVVRTMVTEIVEWCDCHGDFLPDAGFGNWGIICWYSHGTIDYLATARALLQDENLNRRQRFILIYKYCLQDEQTQSEEMFADDLTYVSRIAGLSTTLRSWMDALRSNNPVSWKQITHEVEFGRYYRSKKIQFSENYLGLLHYFKKLTNPEARYRCLYLALGNDSIRPFYLYMCLAGLPDYEVDAMFNRFSERKRYLRGPPKSIPTTENGADCSTRRAGNGAMT
ncbi:uncharacterized protein TNCV_194581 [Trichonephila clavipes]|nr:uncharacterized protein TNCV_194581 [Trichonephila clavipes]